MLDDQAKTGHGNLQNRSKVVGTDSLGRPVYQHTLDAMAPWRFRPGQSGNPSGRTKKDEKARKIEAALDKALEDIDDVVQGVLNIAKDANAPPAVRLQAANVILDRVAGKPQQSVDIHQETKHSLSEEFEFVIRRLNDRNDPITKQIEASVEVYEPEFEELDFANTGFETEDNG